MTQQQWYDHSFSSDILLKSVQDFLPQLKDHILGQICGHHYQGDYVPFSDEECAKIQFRNHIIYQHKVLRVNYTTYDMQREQDSLNPSWQANIMMLAPRPLVLVCPDYRCLPCHHQSSRPTRAYSHEFHLCTVA